MLLSFSTGAFGLLILQALGLSLAALIAVAVIGVVYRLTLHPLAKYPGPLLAKITPIRAAWVAYKGEGAIDLYELHQKYGMQHYHIPKS
jgi:hypothetical protein